MKIRDAAPIALACLSLIGTPLAGAPRQRIGLVLEGGGALGFAHIGVLQWFETNRIPVDVITGTSMGGLIGGLYAAGKTPAEIEALVEEIDWDTVLRGQTAFQDLSYRRKEDRLAFPTRIEFGLRRGLSAPNGLNSGQEVDDIIARSILPYFDLASFDDLPVPFRCVATDMISGKQKVFDSGSLAQALRATMSIPAVFSPAQSGGAVYTDGGALNNLPVDVAKRMGVDIVIAVMLDTGPPDPKALGSALGIAGRTVSIMISANEMHNIEMADILLTADLKGFTAADFTESAAIIPKGVAAAEKKKALLSKLMLPPDDWATYRAGSAARIRTQVPPPQFVTVTGTSPSREREIQKELASVVGEPVDALRIQRKLSRVLGEGAFSSLGYGLVRRDGLDGLQITAVEKAYGPPFLNLGLLVDGSDVSDVRSGLAARLTLLDVGRLGSEWRTDLAFGTSYGVSSEFYQPFGASRWFAAPRGYTSKSRFDVYSSGSRIADYAVRRLGVGFDLGYEFGRRSEIRFGEDVILEGATLKIGTPVAPNGSKTVGDTSVRFQFLGQDDVMLPWDGVVNQSRFDWFSSHPGGSGGGYASAQTAWSFFKPVSERGSLILTLAGGSAFGATGLGLHSFSLSGPLRLGAFGMNELLGNQYFLVQTGYSHKILGLNPLLGDGVYLVGLYEIGKMYGNPRVPNLPMDGSIAAVAKTAFGPVYVGGSVNGSRARWWFGVGRVF